MRTQQDLALHWLDHACQNLSGHLPRLTLAEASFAPSGGYRSILGTLKHTAGWGHVYRSFAFDASPVHWRDLDWPRGLRDTIVPSEDYLHEVIAWLDLSHQRWREDLLRTPETAFDQPRPVHWRATLPLIDIVSLIAGHYLYHAGEINQLLAIYRQEGWEDGEEVEENNLPSEGHRVVPPWRAKPT